MEPWRSRECPEDREIRIILDRLIANNFENYNIFTASADKGEIPEAGISMSQVVSTEKGYVLAENPCALPKVFCDKDEAYTIIMEDNSLEPVHGEVLQGTYRSFIFVRFNKDRMPEIILIADKQGTPLTLYIRK